MDGLPEGLPYSGRECLSLLGGEELLDVEDELRFEVVGEFLIAGEDLDVTVVDEAGVGLDHVLLDNRCAGHGVV